ncbi:MAG: hypothetical protein M5T61_10590 [Acidimicrobiia bacterium]|nr:hypothetical protein [Acidimicrobiia bacterium]
MSSLLLPLGMEVEQARDGAEECASVSVPTFRPDIEREIDVIEEVARRYGLNRIERTVPAGAGRIGGLTSTQRERRLVADVLVGAGCDEVFTLPLVSPVAASRFCGDSTRTVEVENPLRAEESMLRTAILPGLLDSAHFNASHGNPDVTLFEMGHVFASPSGGVAAAGRERPPRGALRRAGAEAPARGRPPRVVGRRGRPDRGGG